MTTLRPSVSTVAVLLFALPALNASGASAGAQAEASLGLFQGSVDIGHAQTGSSHYDAGQQLYTVSGGGADVWGAADDFRFVWTKMSGDAALTADVQVGQPSTHANAKGMLMMRQSLDPGSPYADIAIHGDGHITLQYRLTQGGETKDTNLPEHGATRLRIEHTGDVYTASVSTATSDTGARPKITIAMKGPAYVGLGVCSHSLTALQTVTFSHVQLTPLPPHKAGN